MKLHSVAVTHNITSSTRVMIRLPNTSIIIQFIQKSEIIKRKDLFLDEERPNRNPTHPSTHNNTEFVLCFHAHVELGN
jgi:hypothetical protein